MSKEKLVPQKSFNWKSRLKLETKTICVLNKFKTFAPANRVLRFNLT